MIGRIGLLPLVRRRLPWLLGGLGLVLLTLISGLALLALSGWFIVSSALAGLGLIAMINIFTPGAGIRLFALTRTVARYGERLVSHSATFRLLTDLRMHVFEKLLGQDEAQLRRLQRSDIRSRLSADIDNLDHLYLGVANPGLGALLATALTLIGISLLTPMLALICAGLFLLLNPTIALTCYTSGRAQSEALGNALPELRNRVSEGLEARQELVALGLLDAMTGRIDRDTERINTIQQRIAIIDAIGNGGVLLVGLMTVWIALIMSLALVHENALSGALAGLIILALLGLGESWLAMPAAWRRLAQCRVAAGRVVRIMDQPSELPQPERPRPWPGRFDIRIESLHFRYQAHQLPVINGLDLSIRQGERLVISGPSGCGKTTLARLIMRQMDPDHGRILLGGIDLRELDSKDLRQRIAWLPQQPVLFQDSLAANLRLAAPAASDEELHQALTAVGLAAFVAQRPNGLDTWIDEAGGNVSGGEKRRIALARLFLTQPDIVILDEPTASLDHQTSQLVNAALTSWLKQKTAILITHEPGQLRVDGRHLVMRPAGLIESQ